MHDLDPFLWFGFFVEKYILNRFPRHDHKLPIFTLLRVSLSFFNFLIFFTLNEDDD